VIPTLLLLGFVAGLLPRGWCFVPAATVGWPVLGLLTGVDSGIVFILGAAALGAVNAALGVLVGLALRRLVLGFGF
jgi:hypothetical protein